MKRLKLVSEITPRKISIVPTIKKSIFLFLLLLLNNNNLSTTCASTTHQLSFDSIINNDSILLLNNDNNENEQQEEVIITSILELIVKSLEEGEATTTTTTNLNNIQKYCLDNKIQKTRTCLFEYDNSTTNNNNILSLSGTIKLIKEINNNSETTATSMDITIQTYIHGLSQELLLNIYSNLINTISGSTNNDDTILWSIRDRTKLNDNEEGIDNNNESSFKTKLLSDTKNTKKRLYYKKSPNNNEDEDVEMEIWEYNNKKVLFINSKLRMQSDNDISTLIQAEAYIHPALISHPDPTRVAILSLSPYTYIKEILKYKYIAAIDVIGITNKEMIDAVLKYMPDVNDCSTINGLQSKYCLDEKNNVNFITQHPNDWLQDMLNATRSGKKQNDYADYPDYDVIYIDISSNTMDELYWISVPFLSQLNKLMDNTEDNSMIVINTGMNPPSPSSSLIDTKTTSSKTEKSLLNIIKLGLRSKKIIDFDSYVFYDEPSIVSQSSSSYSSVFLLLFYDLQLSYTRFFRRKTLHIDLDITERLFQSTIPNKSPIVYYDGPTHGRYQVPSKTWETYFCTIKPWGDADTCKVLQNYFNISHHHFNLEVRQHPIRGRTIHALEDIPKGHFIAAQDAALTLQIDEIEHYELTQFIKNNPTADYYKYLHDLFEAYGFEDYILGKTGHSVSIASNSTFINHACNVKDINIVSVLEYYNEISNFTMVSVDTSTSNNEENDYNDDNNTPENTYNAIYKFSPALQRRPDLYGITIVAGRDIKKGEELLQDYKHMSDSKVDGYEAYIKELDDMCNSGIGLVPVDAVDDDDNNDDDENNNDNEDKEEL